MGFDQYHEPPAAAGAGPGAAGPDGDGSLGIGDLRGSSR
jgi:hypothetical protein